MGMASNDQRNVGLRGAEDLSYFGLRHRSGQCSDFGDFDRGQEFLEARDEAYVDGVLFIEPVIRPFKIGGKAIRLDAIDVVDDRKSSRVRHEGDCYQSVNVTGFHEAIAAHVDLRISDGIDARHEDFAVASLQAVPAHAHSVNASHATEIADLVKLAEFGEVNRSPFFCVSGIHVAGCPSDTDGCGSQEPAARFNVRRVRHYDGTLQYIQ